ncbi:MAG: Gfo/Idh/MocA family oxidoreductase [Chloroflexi bacterium]|nr:Gfo/Idh/MocA family oxidoreductase [Chloroflexota bacterium]
MSRYILDLAIVGCGDVARYTAWFARLNRGIRLAACCDSVPERAAQFARRFRIPQVFSDYGQLLAALVSGRSQQPAQATAAAVYLAVPHHLHAPMVERAIRADIPALVEKPLTRTLAEGQEIVAAAQARGVKVGVNYQYRYDAGCYALARAVQAGALGEIRYARCNLPWHRDDRYFAGAGWHAHLVTAGGGTLLTQGSHLLDVVLWALGGRPVTAMGYTARRAFGQVEVEDLAQGIIEMADGALVEVCSSMVAHAEQAASIEVYGARGTAIYSNRPWPHVQFLGVRPAREAPPGGRIHALQRSLEGFRAWIVEGRSYLTPAAEALPVLAAVDAIYRSSRTGRREAVTL